ncbi:MAG: glycoside hydrolase family 25 protein [Williamsia sp.]|nr:glycoside hydrolase family 25 protein [Williamsia sp.]
MPSGKNKRRSRSLFALVLICFFGAFIWWFYLREAPHFVRYNEFGIDIPTDYAIHGIDVSRHQSYIDWDEVKAMEVDNMQIDFAFIKATEGLRKVDDYFSRNWRKARNANMIRGAYHFFIAPKNGREQAMNFIHAVELESGDLPPVLDVEQTYGAPPEKVRANVKAFLETVQQYYGVMPIIYTNVSFYDAYLSTGEFDRYPLWVAHYLQKDQPRITRDWLFWQHSENGRVNGILNQVDFDVFNGDSTTFKQLLVE